MDRASGPVVLWVRDEDTAANTTQQGKNYLLTIQSRTGRISTHPIGAAGDELRPAIDGKESGT